jgi:chorismate mutase-like protein
MPAPAQTLDEIRAEIDRIDQAVHDLLMRRVEVVRRVGKVKGASAPKWRPAREAALIRRLVARHKGEMPVRVLVRIWREVIVGGSLALQEAVSVAVVGRCWDVARDHFGSGVPFKRRSAAQVVRDVAGGKATIGVLPLNGEGGWWKALGKNADAPRIVAKLPFAGGEGDAVAIACVAFEPSGSDRSLFVVASRPKLGRAAVTAALRKAGVSARLVAEDGSAALVEADGFVGADDARLAGLRKAPRLNRVTLIGGYPLPLSKK